MGDIDELLHANARYAEKHVALEDARPRRRLAVLTCMDARVDVLQQLGLALGDAHVLRNAGGRVTDDALRSLTVSVHPLGVSTIAVMQHTQCGIVGVSNEELQQRTGAPLDFLPIADHAETLRADVHRLAQSPYLSPVGTVAGVLYDVQTGRVQEVLRWQRAASE